MNNINQNKNNTEDIITKLRQRFLKAKHLIIDAINNNRPIIIKHHADCDGYCAAIALEKVILPLIELKHRGNTWQYYKRQPMRNPYYDYSECIKDLGFIHSDSKRFRLKPPLILILDNGSSDDDLISFKMLKIYGISIVVIDHHLYNKEIESTVDIFINPRIIEGYNDELTAGILALELAKVINKDFNEDYLGALSCLGDKVDGPYFKKYLSLTINQGYDLEFLKKLCDIIDFEAYYIGGYESHQLVSDIFGKSQEKQKMIIELLYPELNKKIKESLEAAKEVMKVKKYNKDAMSLIIAELDLKHYTRYGYPPSGKIIGKIFDELKMLHKQEDLLVMGYYDDSCIIRINNVSGKAISIDGILNMINEKFPKALVRGGGHKSAGTIKFLPAYKVEILDSIKGLFLNSFG